MKGGCRLCAGLLLAALALAQEDPFADPQKSLAEAKAKLAEYPDASTDEGKRWRPPIELRIKLLEELLRTEQETASLPTIEKVEADRVEAQRAIDDLRAKQAPTKVTLGSAAELAEYDKRLADGRAARDAKQSEVDAWNARHADFDTGRKALPSRESEARRRLADFEKKDDPLSRYRAANARGDLRVIRERTALLDKEAQLWAALSPVLGLQLDLARLRAERAEQEQKLAAAEAARLREAESAAIREKAEAEANAAKRTDDVLERFRLERSAEAATLRSQEAALQSRRAELDAAIKERQDRKQYVARERASLESRLARSSEGTADLLRRVLERTRRSRQVLRAKLAEVDKQTQENQRALTATLDRLWSLELPLEDNDELQNLLASVGPERQEEARRVFADAIQGSNGLIAALRANRTTLELIENQLDELTTRFVEHEEELDQLLVFVQERYLWVRSDPPIDGTLLSDAGKEILALPVPYARTGLWREAGVFGAGTLAGLAVGILLLFIVAARLNVRAVTPSATAGWRSATGHALLGLLAAALPAAGLYGAALAIRALRLPDALGGPLPVFLDFLALVLLIRRTAAYLLREGGVAVRTLGLSAQVAAQLLRGIRLLTLAVLLLRGPSLMLAAEPFGAQSLPRLLDVAWFAALGCTLHILVRRQGAIVQELTKPGTWMRGLWWLVWVAATLLMLSAIGLDALGYRVGASFLVGNTARTVGLLIAIAGFYSILLALVGRIAARVRSRTMQDEGAVAAWRLSATVMDELTQLVAAVVAVAATLAFLHFWGLSETLVRALDGVHLIELAPPPDESYVTLWSVVAALLWVAGGHFVVRNLSALYDTVVSPLLGKTDDAGRYVVLALARYAILVIAYGLALITLKVSFASIGWLLAAISFGVGFGLQEIVANFVSGLILLLERPIRVGDFIEVDGKVAIVDRINIRSTTVTNLDRQTIIIPNKQLITQNLTNWSRNDRVMRRHFRVGVAYGSDVEKVLRVLEEEVKRHTQVLRDPRPSIRFVQFGDSSLDFEVFFFATIEDGLQAVADLHRQIYDRFAKEGIEIPFPQRDLHLRSGWEHLERGNDEKPPGPNV